MTSLLDLAGELKIVLLMLYIYIFLPFFLNKGEWFSPEPARALLAALGRKHC